MSPLRKKSLIKTKKSAIKAQGPLTPPKKSFDFNDFRRSFESLDTQNSGSWPLPVKVTVLLLIVVFIAAHVLLALIPLTGLVCISKPGLSSLLQFL